MSKALKLLGYFFILIGAFLILNSSSNITGFVILEDLDNFIGSFLGIFFIVGGLLALTVSRSHGGLEEIAEKNGWRTFDVNKDSIIKDVEQEYLALAQNNKRTPAQSWAERHATPDRTLIEDNMNRKQSYEEQFFESHAAKGGRVIDAGNHIVNSKEDMDRLIGKNNKGAAFYSGRLIHFGQPANGKYLWIVDEEGDFILANRQTFVHEMPQMATDKIDRAHRLHKLPHSTIGRGRKVYGAGEVLVEAGYIKEYDTASGHYIDLNDIKNFNEQGRKVFEYYAKKVGWKTAKEGAKYKIKY